MFGTTINSISLLIFLLGLALSFQPHSVYSAQTARIKKSTPLYSGPGPEEKVIRNLKLGVTVMVANQPNLGFYKLRTKAGEIGYVPEDAVTVSFQSNRSEYSGDKTTSGSSSRFKTEIMSIKMTGGYWIFNSKELTELLQPSAIQFKNQVGFGGRISYRVHPYFSPILQAETMSRLAFGQNEEGTKRYDYNLKTFPVMIGGQVHLMPYSQGFVNINVLGGLAFGTSFSATALDESAPSVTRYTASPPTFRFGAEFGYNFTKSFFMALEGGFRLLKAEIAQPSSTGVGGVSPNSIPSPLVTTTPSTVEGAPLKIILTGPMVELGLGVRF